MILIDGFLALVVMGACVCLVWVLGRAAYKEAAPLFTKKGRLQRKLDDALERKGKLVVVKRELRGPWGGPDSRPNLIRYEMAADILDAEIASLENEIQNEELKKLEKED